MQGSNTTPGSGFSKVPLTLQATSTVLVESSGSPLITFTELVLVAIRIGPAKTSCPIASMSRIESGSPAIFRLSNDQVKDVLPRGGTAEEWVGMIAKESAPMRSCLPEASSKAIFTQKRFQKKSSLSSKAATINWLFSDQQLTSVRCAGVGLAVDGISSDSCFVVVLAPSVEDCAHCQVNKRSRLERRKIPNF